MKYKQHLTENIAPEYGPEPYLAYGELDDIIRQLSSKAPASADQVSRAVSISAPPPTNARGLPTMSSAEFTDENFFSKMDSELTKVEKHTLEVVTDLRAQIREIEDELQDFDLNDQTTVDRIQAETDAIAEKFLTLEKYVNLNFMGFHKILKKHDKYCPGNPCKTFYVSRMHSQAWVRGDYSDVVVRLSAIYSALRDDTAAEESQDASQSFLRSTAKYWIKTEDISRVKYAVLRHLPVFLQKTSTGESDSQLCNSVYLENDQLELYHNRLDKTPGAIALRLRWYGSGDPDVVFVERKTHRDRWTGETSVKERFAIKENEVKDVLGGAYLIAQKKREMLEKGASQEEADDWELLASEICQVLQTKQLVPTMRTQYMRTAFQIPFDQSVRVSLDTNLCMISERGYDTKGGKYWRRDPSKMINHTEITRFPHAILEIKLELKGGNLVPPRWVTDLQNSGMLYEVHKFSKYIHGCSVLLPEDVRCVPYWVDDVSVRDSIIASGGGRILIRTDLSDGEKSKMNNAGAGPGANQAYGHLLPFGDVEHDRSKTAMGRSATSAAAAMDKIQTASKQGQKKGTPGVNFYDADDEEIGDEGEDGCCSWIFPFCSNQNSYHLSDVAPTSMQQIEPKVFFANERTTTGQLASADTGITLLLFILTDSQYMHWLHQGITLYTIASGILAFASKGEESWAHWYAMALLPISLGFCVYALHVFLWRADRIKSRVPGSWDDPRGAMILGGSLVLVLVINFLAKLFVIAKYNSIKSDL